MLSQGINPRDIIVTTFTNKAALEMKERIRVLINDNNLSSRLLLGTFHGICLRYLRRFGHKIGIANGFSIAAERDSNDMMKKVIKSFPADIIQKYKKSIGPYLAYSDSQLTGVISGYLTSISKLKSNGITSDNFKLLPSEKSKYNPELPYIYSNYQQLLIENNLLDFDDLQLNCLKLLTLFGKDICSNIRHVLVDEFQDTNDLQLQLIYLFSDNNKNLTIVGDPDQSIYKFRNAESKNFNKLKDHFKDTCKVITLDQNYRSTTSILQVSELLMTQDKHRDNKNLVSNLNNSFPIKFHESIGAKEEAIWIVKQISKLLEIPNLLEKNSIAILIRAGYQSRLIEQSLISKSIHYTIVKGRRFWDRKEITTMIDYLRVINSDGDINALLRTINYPKRGIGEKSIEKIDELLSSNYKSSLELLKYTIYYHGLKKKEQKVEIEKINDKHINELISNVKGAALKGIERYIEIIEKSREIINSNLESIENVLKAFDYIYKESGFEKEIHVDEERKLNVGELRQQISESKPIETEILEGDDLDDDDLKPSSMLERFLISVQLYDKTNNNLGDISKPSVTISTIHAAKGLEWPVVFIPGLNEGVIPSRFSSKEEDVDEERRCLYVSMTRAQVLLHLSRYKVHYNYYGGESQKPSRFLTDEIKKLCLTDQTWEKNIPDLYSLLNKQIPEDYANELENAKKKGKGKKKGGKVKKILNDGFKTANAVLKSENKENIYDSMINSAIKEKEKENKIEVKNDEIILPSPPIQSHIGLSTQTVVEDNGKPTLKRRRKRLGTGHRVQQKA